MLQRQGGREESFAVDARSEMNDTRQSCRREHAKEVCKARRLAAAICYAASTWRRQRRRRARVSPAYVTYDASQVVCRITLLQLLDGWGSMQSAAELYFSFGASDGLDPSRLKQIQHNAAD